MSIKPTISKFYFPRHCKYTHTHFKKKRGYINVKFSKVSSLDWKQKMSIELTERNFYFLRHQKNAHTDVREKKKHVNFDTYFKRTFGVANLRRQNFFF